MTMNYNVWTFLSFIEIVPGIPTHDKSALIEVMVRYKATPQPILTKFYDAIRRQYAIVTWYSILYKHINL